MNNRKLDYVGNLSLTRKVGERIIIIDPNGKGVKLGIDASKHYYVVRTNNLPKSKDLDGRL